MRVTRGKGKKNSTYCIPEWHRASRSGLGNTLTTELKCVWHVPGRVENRPTQESPPVDPDKGLLPYAELAKDDIQDIFGVHQSRDLAYRLCSIA